MITFPAPASSNAACGALRFPACFTSRVMRPRVGSAFAEPPATGPGSHRTPLMQPAPTPQQIPGGIICRRIFFSPSCGGSNAQSRSSSPTRQDRVDDQQRHGIPSWLSQQRAPRLHCGHWGRHTPQTAHAPKLARNPKLSPFAKSTIRLLSSFIATCRSNSSRSRLSTAAQPVMPLIGVHKNYDHPPSARPHTCTARFGPLQLRSTSSFQQGYPALRPFLPVRFQNLLEQRQEVHPACHLFQQQVMPDVVKVALRSTRYARLVTHDSLRNSLYRCMRTALRSVAIRPRLKISLEDRLHYQLERSLHHPVPDCRYPQHADLAPVLRYLLSPVPQRQVLARAAMKRSKASMASASIPGLPSFLLDAYASRSVSSLQTCTRPQNRHSGSAFAFTYIRRVLQFDRRLSHLASASHSLRQQGLPPPALPGFTGTTSPSATLACQPISRCCRLYGLPLLRRFLNGARRASPVA